MTEGKERGREDDTINSGEEGLQSLDGEMLPPGHPDELRKTAEKMSKVIQEKLKKGEKPPKQENKE